MESREMLTTGQAAELLSIEPRTLESWRLRGVGPRYRKLGRLVRYSQRDLVEWTDAQTRTSTTAPAPTAGRVA